MNNMYIKSRQWIKTRLTGAGCMMFARTTSLMAISALVIGGSLAGSKPIASDPESHIWGLTVRDDGRWEHHFYYVMTVGQIEQVLRRNYRGRDKIDFAEFASFLRTQSLNHGYDPALVLAIIQAESGFRSGIVSHKGATGLMQVLPSTAKEVSKRYQIAYSGPKSLKNPHTNVTIGIKYLSQLRVRNGKTLERLLGAYNAGPAKIGRLVASNRYFPPETVKYIREIRGSVPVIRSTSESLENQAINGDIPFATKIAARE